MQLNVKPGYEALAEAFEQCAEVHLPQVVKGAEETHTLCGPRYLAGVAIHAFMLSPGSPGVKIAVVSVAELIRVLEKSAPNRERREGVYQMALDQAQSGKGVQQHGKNFNDGSEAPKPFTEQAIFTITKMVGGGFCIGQAIKKISEAMVKFDRGEKDACVRELLGAMVYAASTLIKTGE